MELAFVPSLARPAGTARGFTATESRSEQHNSTAEQRNSTTELHNGSRG